MRRGQRFLITSHARPDGDSIGSQVAMALALRALGKDARMVNRDAPPAHYAEFEGVGDIEVAPAVEGEYDALFVMECGDITRPGVRRASNATARSTSTITSATPGTARQLVRQQLRRVRRDGRRGVDALGRP